MRADGDRAVRVAILDMGISVPIELNVVPLGEGRQITEQRTEANSSLMEDATQVREDGSDQIKSQCSP